MNIVCCKIIQCPFNEKEFCTNSVVAIEPEGHCSILWRKGVPQPLFDALNKGNKINLVIEEGEYINEYDQHYESDNDDTQTVSGHTEGKSRTSEGPTEGQSKDKSDNNESECGAIETLRNAYKESPGSGNDESGIKETDGRNTNDVK